jgi:protein O-GlcNAc transferase
VARANDLADALIAEGNKAENSGNFREACEQYRKAVAAAPGYARAQLNLGIGLEAVGDAEGAIRAYRAALAADAADAYANYNLGKLLYSHGDLKESETLLRLALGRQPEFPEAHVALANVYDSQANPAAAAVELEIALKQRPDYAGAIYNYASVLGKLGRHGEAQAAWGRVLVMDPGVAEPALRSAIAAGRGDVSAYVMLASALVRQCRIEEALEVCRAARAHAPERFEPESTELFVFNLSASVSAEDLFARHRAYGARLESAFPARFAPFRNARDPGRRLRIGYVSGDFCTHPVALFFIPLLERHDRSACEVYCYSVGQTADGITRRIQAGSDFWRDARALADADLADAINRDSIDILVDLEGHTGFRLGVFSQQPAPVQAAWLGYLNTTGLTRIGYRLCDKYSDPPGESDRLHTETLIRLPHSQWCYRPFVSQPHATEAPFERNGFMTFGSFNHIQKISPEVRRLWAEILVRLPRSRLVVIGVPEGGVRDALSRDLQAAGAAADRITFVPHVDMQQYFRWFDAVDIALDTAPYSGGTTTCDALWMGVPVVTVPGSLPASRSTASILSTVGLANWIAPTPEDYVRLAVEFGRDAALLVGLRASLRQKMLDSPIMDETHFARDIEAAYRQMWSNWCAAG